MPLTLTTAGTKIHPPHLVTPLRGTATADTGIASALTGVLETLGASQDVV